MYGHDAQKPRPSLLYKVLPYFVIITIQVNEKSWRLRMGAYRDGVKRKGDKIGMGL